MLKESIDLHHQGRLEEAESGYRTHLAEEPDDVDALHLLGLLRAQRGDTEEAMRLLGRAHDLAPEEATLEAALAALHFRESRFDAAEQGYRRALELDPNLGSAHAGIGQIAVLNGKGALAEHHFRIALRAGEDAQALSGLGGLLLERGDVEAALRHLGRAGDLAPDDAMIQITLGRAFAQRGTPAFAERAFMNALRLRPDLNHVRPLLASLLMKAKRISEAEAHFRALLSAPDFAAAGYVGLGDAARAESRLTDAAGHYRAALAIDPLQPMPVRALAWTLSRLAQYDAAIAAYDDYLARVPQDFSMHVDRAELLAEMGRMPEAAQAWRALNLQRPDNLQVRGRLALLEEYLGRAEHAHAEAESILRIVPDDAEMLLLRIRGLLQRGENARAREQLDRLGGSSLTDAQARLRWHYLGHLHERTGRFSDAVRCFTEAHRSLSSSMPALGDLHPDFIAALSEPVGTAWAQAPVLLLGTPGSDVERVAALLAEQPQLTVMRDRTGTVVRDDDFSRPRFSYYAGPLSEDERELLRERYLSPMRALNVPLDRTLVDWLPRWDAHLLALIRRAMPGTRLIIVERDPRDALLNWLAFGWAEGFACPEPNVAAAWLARARRHLHFCAQLDEPQHLIVAADTLLDAPEHAGTELARFLGIDALAAQAPLAMTASAPGDLPVRFAAGHWQCYKDVLAEPFSHF